MTRRSGSMREVRDGVWRLRVMIGGRCRSSTCYGTREDAEEMLKRLVADARREQATDGTTLDDYFWRSFVPGRERTSTIASVKTYQSVWRNHIAPELGKRPIADIDNIEIQRWVDGLPPQSAQAYTRALRAVLSQAAFDHVIERSPMAGYRFRMPRGRDTSPLPVWGAVEVMAALDAPGFVGSQLYALWLVMVGAGLSRSEALALDWEGIAWADAGAGHVVAVVSVERACTATDGMKEPKNSRRYRRVPMAPLFADRLARVAGSGPICQSRHGSVPTGRRLTPCYVPRRWRQLFADGAPLARLPFVPINRMRATYATLAQSAGLDATIINAMQGRSEGSTVLYSNYLNPVSQTLRDAALSIADVAGKPRELGENFEKRG